MQKIAKFQKVSETQFIQDWLDTFPASTAAEAAQIYDHRNWRSPVVIWLVCMELIFRELQ